MHGLDGRFPEAQDIPEAQALGVPIRVVSAATHLGLVRGIAHFTGFGEIVREVRRSVGVLEDVSDWARAEYHMPSYLLDGWEIPGGIFIYPWEEDEDWRDPKKRHPSRRGRLLYLPSGWVNHNVNPRRG